MLRVLYNGKLVLAREMPRTPNHTIGTIKAAACAESPDIGIATELLACDRYGAILEEHRFLSELRTSAPRRASSPGENALPELYIVLLRATEPCVEMHEAALHGSETAQVGEIAGRVQWEWGTRPPPPKDAAAAHEGDLYRVFTMDIFKIFCNHVASPVLMIDMRAVCRRWRDYIDEHELLRQFYDESAARCGYDGGHFVAKRVLCPEEEEEGEGPRLLDAMVMDGFMDSVTGPADWEEHIQYKRAKRVARELPYYAQAVTRSVAKTCCAFPEPVTERERVRMVQLVMYPLLESSNTPPAHLKGVARVLRLYLGAARAPHASPLHSGEWAAIDSEMRFIRAARCVLPSVIYAQCVNTHYALFCDDEACYEIWIDALGAYHACRLNAARAHAALRALRYVLWESSDLYCNVCERNAWRRPGLKEKK